MALLQDVDVMGRDGLETPQRLFAIVVPAADLAVLQPILATSSISVIVLESLLSECVLQRDDGGRALAVEETAMFVGALVTSIAGCNAIDAARLDLDLFFGQIPFAILDLTDQTGVDIFSGWLTERLLTVGAVLFEDAIRVRRSLATLRRDHEETLERFAEIEGATASFATPQRIAKLNFPPSASRIVLYGGDGDKGANRARQPLPTRAAGIGAIELYVGEVEAQASGGTFRVDLLLGDAIAPIHTWSIGADQMQTEWMRLNLDRSLVGREQAGALEITWSAPAGADMSLALGHPNPLPEFCVAVANGFRCHAPLALRVWSMVPGTIVARAASEITATQVSSKIEPLRFALSTDELSGVERISPSQTTVEWKLVNHRVDERDILVHPVKGHTAVAVVRDLNVQRIGALSALVLVDNREANPVEFGLAVVPHQTTYAHPERLIHRWTAVQPQIHTEVPGTVDTRSDGRLDLLLATRMAGDADPNQAWAYFKRIEVTV